MIWVQHADDELALGSPAWQWMPELVPADGEPLIHKHFNSSLELTALEAKLARLGANHIVPAGAATHWCILATAYAALERGYDLALIEGAHTTGRITLDDGTTIEAAGVVRELNIAMTWLRYPGRANGTAKAERADFAAAGGVR